MSDPEGTSMPESDEVSKAKEVLGNAAMNMMDLADDAMFHELVESMSESVTRLSLYLRQHGFSWSQVASSIAGGQASVVSTLQEKFNA